MAKFLIESLIRTPYWDKISSVMLNFSFGIIISPKAIETLKEILELDIMSDFSEVVNFIGQSPLQSCDNETYSSKRRVFAPPKNLTCHSWRLPTNPIFEIVFTSYN